METKKSWRETLSLRKKKEIVKTVETKAKTVETKADGGKTERKRFGGAKKANLVVNLQVNGRTG